MSTLTNKPYRRGQVHLSAKELNKSQRQEKHARRGVSIQKGSGQTGLRPISNNQGQEITSVVYPLLYKTTSEVDTEVTPNTIDGKSASAADGAVTGAAETFTVITEPEA